MKAHWSADIFPLNEADIERLAEDIKANGQLRPIIVWNGEILDGRTRFAACKKAGIEPVFEDYQPANGTPADEELASFSWAMNEVRRHLTASQRACAAAEVVERTPPERGGKRAKGSKAINCLWSITDRFGVNKETVRQARELLRESPEEFAQVKAGNKTVADAHKEHVRIRDATKKLHVEAETRGRLDTLEATHPDLAEKVQSGLMAWDEAEKEAAARVKEAAARMDGLHRLLSSVGVAMSTIQEAFKVMSVADWKDILTERHGWQRENYLRDIDGTVEALRYMETYIKEIES